MKFCCNRFESFGGLAVDGFLALMPQAPFDFRTGVVLGGSVWDQ